MGINWDEVEEQYDKGYKDYAPEGKHKVKCIDCEAKQVGSKGTYILKFIFEEDDNYQYQTADCWVSKDKEKFRYHYIKNLFMVLGAPEDKAKAVIEKAEEKGDYDFAVTTYEASFKRLLAKKPEAEIEVYRDDRNPKYCRATFTDKRVYMKRDTQKVADVMGGGEVIPQADDLDMPF